MPARRTSQEDKSVLVSYAAKELSRLLKEYWNLTPGDRDVMLEYCVDELVEVYKLLNPLLQPSSEREKLLKLNKEFAPLEDAINETIQKAPRRKKQ